jgi:type I restriction enzyme, R subunit
VDLVEQLDAEQLRAAEEGLSEDELAVFDLLQRENLSKADRERVKLASKNQLESLQRQIASMARWTEKEKTQAEVKVSILDRLYQDLPMPPFTSQEITATADRVFQYAWSQAASEYLAGA